MAEQLSPPETAGPIRPGDRVMVVSTHPDDVDFGAAGTVALWTSAGVEVTYVIVTDGQRGSAEDSRDPDQLPETRRSEQRAAAKVVGVTDVRFLGFEDGDVHPSHELRMALTSVVRELRPRLIISPSPDRTWLFLPASHPDHLAVGEAVTRVVYPDARNPFMFPELAKRDLSAYAVPELWLMASPYAFAGPSEPPPARRSTDPLAPPLYRTVLRTFSTAVDVSATFDKKIEAIECHQSQIADAEELRERVRGWLTASAALYGLDGGLAEIFQVIRIPS
jgi:LmbE family N-acetylglucosaminyl deacetylase